MSIRASLTFRKGMGTPMSTLRIWTLIADDVMSVMPFKKSLNTFSPSLLARSHFSVKSVSTIFPVLFSVMTLTLSESRSFMIVEVVSKFLPLKSLLFSILLINVVFPALVSPKCI